MGTFNFEEAGRDETAMFLARAALAAGITVMDVYARGCDVEVKTDGSPVTIADRRAEEVICAFLGSAAALPPVVAEESAAQAWPLAANRRFLLIDPLDGTREFLARNGEFTINVALIEEGAPIAGAVYAPALDRLWFGGGSAYVCEAHPDKDLPDPVKWKPIRTRAAPQALTAVASRSHSDARTEAFLSRLPIAERRSRGSSLKFCLVAEGAADVYPRFGPTMEWDTAAGDAVLRAAGGVVLDLSDAPLRYGKLEQALKNGPFIAWGEVGAAARFGIVNPSSTPRDQQ